MNTTLLRLTTAGVIATALALPAAAASAHEPTCSGLGGIEVHGQHIVGDYVTGLGGIGGGIEWPPNGEVGAAIGGAGGAVSPGGPGPAFHWDELAVPPGASFCNANAHPNGFTPPEGPPSSPGRD